MVSAMRRLPQSYPYLVPVIVATDNFISIDNNQQNKIEDLRLQKIYWAHGELRARIIWKFRNGVKRYTVTWWRIGSCAKDDNGNLTLTATTKVMFKSKNIFFALLIFLGVLL